MSAIRVACGNFLEMYDFMVFGYYAAEIGRTFFPGGSPFIELLLSFMTFGAGFLMRPLGAIILGAYVDRIGVRKGLILTLLLMAVGTVALAFMPGYARIGLAAPLLILIARLIQGFSAGVEIGTSSVFLSQMAPEGRKGFFVSFQSASQQIAVVVAAALGFGLQRALSPADMESWGWRIPLLIGCAIVPLLFILRRSLSEQEGAPTHHQSASEVMRVLAANWRRALTGAVMVLMTTVSFYTITAYTPSFGRSELHLSAAASLIVTACVGVSNLIWLPLAGALSDRIGRRPILLTAAGLAVVTAYPVLRWVVAAPSFERLLAAELWLSALYGCYNGALVVFLTEYIPERIRTSGFSLAYSLATCVGGFTPAIATATIHATGDAAIPGACLSVAALLSLGAVLIAGAPRVAENST